MSDLASRQCVPCKGGAPPLHGAALLLLLRQLGPEGNGWRVVDEHHLEKDYRFRDFAQALAFVNRVGAIAEAQGHHPDVALAWGHARITIWTHTIDGLTESDFVFAAKCDRVEVA
ncbi:MAG: 4a-hydroxytetrahydrobiopterin dehydratase [Deltaproteobacteria bacterium]|nr:4a-hydroxytetrahydrobiopterin dehydratase [Deltaproteobacteria bacterium]